MMGSCTTTRQDMLAATRSSDRPGTDPPPEPPEGMWSCQHLDLGPVILIIDWPPELLENKFLLF